MNTRYSVSARDVVSCWLPNLLIISNYILCEVQGLGFKKVDGFALKLNPTIEYIPCSYYYNYGANKDCLTYRFSRDELKEFKEGSDV